MRGCGLDVCAASLETNIVGLYASVKEKMALMSSVMMMGSEIIYGCLARTEL